MALPRMQTLADIQARCYVCPETGCWLWRGAVHQRGKQPLARIDKPGTAGQPGGSAPMQPVARLVHALTHRGAWPAPGLWHWTRCGQAACLAPDHQISGTRKQRWAHLLKQGWRRSADHEAAVLLGVIRRQARRATQAPDQPQAQAQAQPMSPTQATPAIPPQAVRGASVFHLR